MPQKGGLVWKRGGFARHATHVTPYAEDQLYPAGKYVPQTSGEPSMGLPQWLEDHSSKNIENTDVVLWHTFGLTHFPRAEDFPLMPTEAVSLILRPNNFFERNPGLDIRPSACSFPGHEVDGRDKGSVYAKPAENVSKGCGCEANL
jgi:primary-amine oxidase